MKVILAFVAILGLAAADDLSDIKAILACFDKALTDGLPSVDIPPHDPLQVPDLTYGTKRSGTYFGLTNITLDGLLNYNFTTLDVAETSSDQDTVVYDYSVHWPKLSLSGRYEIEYDIKIIYDWSNFSLRGDYKYGLEDLTWSGTFNLTKGGQEKSKTKVNDFTVSSVVKGVSAKITGLEPLDRVANVVMKALIGELHNDFPAIFAELLNRFLFNGYWLGHPERIQAVKDHCGLSN